MRAVGAGEPRRVGEQSADAVEPRARSTDWSPGRPGVPNERLNRYLSGFRFGHFVSKEQKAGLVEQVRERLRVAEAAPRPDENVIKELKRLIETIPGNISS